jgi:hypothetical protein
MKRVLCIDKSRRDNTLLTVCFSLRTRQTHIPQAEQAGNVLFLSTNGTNVTNILSVFIRDIRVIRGRKNILSVFIRVLRDIRG